MTPEPQGSAARMMLITSGAETIPMGLEAQLFAKSNKKAPTLSLVQKNEIRSDNSRGYKASRISVQYGATTPILNWENYNKGLDGVSTG